MWVGIDGNGNGTVEQCGVAATMVNGSPKYLSLVRVLRRSVR